VPSLWLRRRHLLQSESDSRLRPAASLSRSVTVTVTVHGRIVHTPGRAGTHLYVLVHSMLGYHAQAPISYHYMPVHTVMFYHGVILQVLPRLCTRFRVILPVPVVHTRGKWYILEGNVHTFKLG
jgi:hypothetical protein